MGLFSRSRIVYDTDQKTEVDSTISDLADFAKAQE
jgi:hypothetical protein